MTTKDKQSVISAIQEFVPDYSPGSEWCNFAKSVDAVIDGANDINDVAVGLQAEVDYYQRALQGAERLNDN